MTIAECVRRSAVALVEAGHDPDGARRDVAVLGRHLLGWDTAVWLSRLRDEAPEGLARSLGALVARRATGEPVAYLTGTREFFGRPFSVSRAVLIPRPETELLVERALAAIDEAAGSLRAVVDVGTGSGCIAVTLAVERPGLQVTATDTSAAALAVAADNARRHGVTDRLEMRLGSLTAGCAPVDLVVSNPPYVGQGERANLLRDVRDFEPAGALFAGGDGLDVIRPLVGEAAAVLNPDGRLLLEIGDGQADAVTDLCQAAGFRAVHVWNDLAGRRRVVEARWPAASV